MLLGILCYALQQRRKILPVFDMLRVVVNFILTLLEHVADAKVPRPPNVLIRPFMGEIKGDSQRCTDLLLHRGPTS